MQKCLEFCNSHVKQCFLVLFVVSYKLQSSLLTQATAQIETEVSLDFRAVDRPCVSTSEQHDLAEAISRGRLQMAVRSHKIRLLLSTICADFASSKFFHGRPSLFVLVLSILENMFCSRILRTVAPEVLRTMLNEHSLVQQSPVTIRQMIATGLQYVIHSCF